MQELIKIEKRVIGAEEVNSANARDLYKELEISQKFADWIKSQINRAGLRENVDYILVSLKSETKGRGGNRKEIKDYIITTDASKHIAMMSQGSKAKQVRDYFIAVEKEYMTNVNAGGAEILQQITPVLQQMTQMMSVILENQQTQQKEILELKEAQAKQLVQISKPVYEHKTLTTKQMDKIKVAIAKSAIDVAEYHKLSVPTATRVLFGELNGRMGVSTYYQILGAEFFKAMLFIRNAGEKARLGSENINAILADEATNSYDEYDDSSYDEPADKE